MVVLAQSKAKTFCASLSVVCLSLCFNPEAVAKKDHHPRLREAALLTGYPGWDLVVTTPGDTLTLQDQKDDFPGTGLPSMSLDGRVVASARVVKEGTSAPKLVIGTYSIPENKWKEYRRIDGSAGAIAISKDGSKLAFAASERAAIPPYRLHIIDLETGIETLGPSIGHGWPGMMSWAPDGRRMVFDVTENRSPPGQIPELRPAIYVLDLETNTVTKIADGQSPAWAPSGEWIAYLVFTPDRGSPDIIGGSPDPNRVMLVRPDGTNPKVLMTISERRFLFSLEQRIFRLAPVWSPDSIRLLLNEYVNADKFTFDVHLLELSTLRFTRRFKDVPPVYGWANAK